MAAKLLHPFLLCSDINLKNLINIFNYDDEHLLITSKPFIKRFDINEKKQVNSWVTVSWQPFTCGAVKDPQNDNICVVINNSSLWMWTVDKDIQTAKKHVFTSEIKELKPHKNAVYIIYSCGFVECLSTALSRHKEKKKKMLKTGEEILQCQIFEEIKEVALLTQNKRKTFLHRYKIGSYAKLVQYQVELKNFSLTGSSIFSSGNLITIWSDGNLYSSDILDSTKTFRLGSSKGRISSLKPSKKIKIIELSQNYMVLQGMKNNEEGGIVVLWDAKFRVSVSSKPLKMYTDPPLAWSVGCGVVVGDGRHLFYIPVSLAPSTIASMFGVSIGEKRYSHDECAAWVASSESAPARIEKEESSRASQAILSNKSVMLATRISNLKQGGSVSEDIIVDLVVLDLVERRDTPLLFECLVAFSFIPEKSLVQILKFFVELPEEHFVRSSAAPEEPKGMKNKKFPEAKVNGAGEPHQNDSISYAMVTFEKEQNGAESGEQVKSPFSDAKSRRINEVLVKPFTVSELSKAMQGMDFNASLPLLDYLHFLLASGTAQILNDKDTKLPTIETTSIWLSLLLDANYHQLVMTSEVETHRKLLTCFSDITSLHDFLEASHSIDNLVDRILFMKPMPKTQNNKPYCIERIIFK